MGKEKTIGENLEKLNDGIKKVNEALAEIRSLEDTLEREVKPFGNGSHITLPKEHSNKKAFVIIKES